MKKSKDKNTFRTLKYFYQSAKPNLKYGIGAIVLAPIGEVLVMLVPPVLVASILSKLQSGIVDKSDVWHLLYIYAGAMIAGEILWRITVYCMCKFESLTMVNMAHDAIRRLIYKDINFFNNNFAGALTAKFNRYVNIFETFFDTIIFEVLRFAVAVTFTSVILWKKNYQLVLAFLFIWFIYMLILKKIIKKQMQLNRVSNSQDR